MFSKILIANRGEIACRIIKTCRRLGVKTVVVYSEADAGSLAVELADETVFIGGSPASESYLVADKIVDAVRETGAEAIHPGFGFLSENPDFARRLQKEKIAFIGPNPEAIEAMGDKITSKKFAADAGVSTVPGHMDLIEDAAEAVKISKKIGYPVMIKASAGGGGKGMRIAWNDEEAKEGFAAAKAEAIGSFGDDRIFIEKFVTQPRHIEIQVLADKHGNVVYLNERECSIQRRNQKVLEEAPSSFLDEATRKAMGEQSVALSKAVEYESAGTVEFIVDKDRNFYFLEMNTRLQVEHPVTELITGVDLVEQMIRVAAGEKLEIKQSDVKIDGWSIESRIYAEDPYRNFLPSIGRLVRYQPPAESTEDGLTVRNDTGVYEGGEISMFYDPMIAKLITHAPTREAAIDHMADALDRFYIDGIQHNVPFLSAIMQHERWVTGNISTNFIADEYPDGFEPRKAEGEELKVLTCVAAAIDYLGNTRRRDITDQMHGRRVVFAEDRVVVISDENQDVRVEQVAHDTDDLNIHFQGKSAETIAVSSNWWFGEPIWDGTVGGKQVAVQVRPIDNGFELSYAGVTSATYVYTKREAELAALMPVKEAPDTSKLLLCPMPGLVVKLMVEEGEEVKAGQSLCIVEAMKMENILKAERDTAVTKINAEEGDSLAVDAVIMEFE